MTTILTPPLLDKQTYYSGPCAYCGCTTTQPLAMCQTCQSFDDPVYIAVRNRRIRAFTHPSKDSSPWPST